MYYRFDNVWQLILFMLGWIALWALVYGLHCLFDDNARVIRNMLYRMKHRKICLKGKNMRWKYRNDLDIKPGDERKVTEFLIFPKCINNEYRWLEKTTYIQEAYVYSDHVEWVDYAWNDQMKSA